MSWIGCIGGLLGIISFAESYLEKIILAIMESKKKHKDEASWTVAMQVGLDATGLSVRLLPPTLHRHLST